MFIQHLTTKRVNLNLPAALHAGAFEPQIQSADSRKQTSEGHFPSPSRFFRIFYFFFFFFCNDSTRGSTIF